MLSQELIQTEQGLFNKLLHIDHKQSGRYENRVPLYPYEELYTFLKVIDDADKSSRIKEYIDRKELERGRGRPLPKHREYTLSKIRHLCGSNKSPTAQRDIMIQLVDLGFVNCIKDKRKFKQKQVLLIYTMNDRGREFLRKYENWIERLNKEFN